MIVVRELGETFWHVPAGVDLEDDSAVIRRSGWSTLCGRRLKSKTAELSRRAPRDSEACRDCVRLQWNCPTRGREADPKWE